ncbi:MAG: ABC transporter ATP-binding protein [Bacteroidota bacterium]|nr:ABC transporter ATP-binding protein [Bacteroidota bacterium]MDX5431211.1 ABC transporter ATP-binding protein [Bacteroidota bacterium]MDX5469950.1 ABC transporter ATP-binding protein [Bacteroidota bacterium]
MTKAFEIQVEGAGKKFGRDWIFKDVTLEFSPGEKVAILGQNGSGKSTFLMAISGFYALSKGKISWHVEGKPIDDLHWYQHYSLISPLLELPEDFSIDEFIDLHFHLKPMKAGWDKQRMLERTGLEASRHKQLKQLSSGMRQRLKLLAAFVPDVPVIFLDEPCTNLDDQGIAFYRELIDESKDQLLLIASNMNVEYDFCDRLIHIDGLR